MCGFIARGGIILLMLITAAKAGDSYPIRLSEPAHPGEQFELIVEEHNKHSEKWADGRNGNKPIETEIHMELKGTETVDAVTDNGGVSKLRFKVTKCLKDGQDFLPAGVTVVAANTDGLTRFELQGGKLNDQQNSVLSNLIFASRPDEPTTDQKIGTEKPQQVGDMWPVNGEALARATRLPFKVTADDFTGHAKLLAVNMVNGKLAETIEDEHTCAFERREGSNGKRYLNLSRKVGTTITLPIELPRAWCDTTSTVDFSETFTDANGTRDIKDVTTLAMRCKAVK